MVKSSKSSSNNSSRSNINTTVKRNKFSVYEFNFDDELVEKDSQKILSKLKGRTRKFTASPVDKYSFLNCFSQGTKMHENDFGNESLDIEDSDDNMEERICSSDAAVLSGFSNCKSLAYCHIDSKNSFPGARSSIQDDIKPGGRVNNNQMLCVDSDDDQGTNLHGEPISVDSDDDCRVECRSSISALDLARNGGSLGERPVACELDIEAMVVVNPVCTRLDHVHYTNASLTFSRRFIKLEGSTLHGTRKYFNWLISDLVKVQSVWYREIETFVVDLHLKCEGEKVAEIDDKLSGIQNLNFHVCDPQWPERKAAIESLEIRYQAVWNTVVDIDSIRSDASFLEQKSATSPKDCWSKSIEALEKNIIYPEGDPDAVSISMKDIELLRPATFINDTIIDCYIKYLEQKIKTEEKHRFHFFNSFFFRKLADLDRDPSTACKGRASFDRVRKWTRKVNLFEKDYLFVPVNFSLHWSLIVICHPGEVAYSRDEEMEKALKVPCILHMDSIRGSHRGLKNLFRSYLWEEWRERHPAPSEDVSMKFLNLLFVTLELPQQENSFDCGIFLLYYVERFLEQAPVNFSPSIRASKFLNKEWFPPAEASSRRQHIKKVIYRIVNNNTRKDPPASKDNCTLPNVVAGDIGKEFLQEVCYGREACRGSYSATNTDKEIKITSPIRSTQGLLGLGSTAKSVAEGTYRWCHRLLSVNRFCNTMSPMQEEEKANSEQTASSSIDKAGGGSGSSLLHKYEDAEPSSENFNGMSPITLEMQDEEDFVNEVVLISEEGNESPSVSSEDLAAFVVEDSEENVDYFIDDNENSHSSEFKKISMYD